MEERVGGQAMFKLPTGSYEPCEKISLLHLPLEGRTQTALCRQREGLG